MIDTPHSLGSAGKARAKIYQAALRLFAERGSEGITVSDLAQAAGIARGTIYNNVDEPENLFGEVASRLAQEMIGRGEQTMRDIVEPSRRLATGMRLFVRRAHEEQDWARFLIRFALGHTPLQSMMNKPPAQDIARAIETGEFAVEADKLTALVSLLTGATLAAMSAVVRGDQAWRDAGSAAAELFLRAGGLDPTKARLLANAELPLLAQLPRGSRPSARRRTS